MKNLTCLLLLITQILFAQTVTISGQFNTDGNSPLPREEYSFNIYNYGHLYLSVGNHLSDPNVFVSDNEVTISNIDVEYSTTYSFRIVSVAGGFESAPGAAIIHTTPNAPEPPTDNLTPVLSNFHIKPGEGNRIYFDSSEDITGTNHNGFTVSGKTITGVHIENGTTGHYFTVSSAFNFWQQGRTIKYTGGSNIEDAETNSVYPFTLQHIVNTMPEPSRSGNTYYVTSSGNNGNSGTSEGTAWRTLTYAFNQVRAGDLVYVKAGNYGNETMTLGVSGQVDNPIKIVGYRNTPNDISTTYWTDYSDGSFDSSEMPYFNSGNRSTSNLITTTGRQYIIIKNIQAEDYNQVIYSTSGNNQYYKRILGNDLGDPDDYGGAGIHTHGQNISIIDCVISNHSAVNMRMMDSSLYNLVDNFTSLCNQSTETGSVAATDYYLSSQGNYNVIKNSYIKRVGDLQHHGHGYTFKDIGGEVRGNLLENSTIVNVKQAIDLNLVVYETVIRNVEVIDGNYSGALTGGVKLSSNCHDNIFEYLKIDGVSDAAIEMEAISGGDHSGNKFIGCIFKDMGTLVGSASDADTMSFINCTFSNISNVGSGLNGTNSFSNSIFYNVNNNGSAANFEYSNFWSGFGTPSGTGNISVNPNFVNTVDFVSQNSSLNAGSLDGGSEYDRNGKERVKKTIGAIEQ